MTPKKRRTPRLLRNRHTFEFVTRYPHGTSAINGYRRAARHFKFHTLEDPTTVGTDTCRLLIHKSARKLREACETPRGSVLFKRRRTYRRSRNVAGIRQGHPLVRPRLEVLGPGAGRRRFRKSWLGACHRRIGCLLPSDPSSRQESLSRTARGRGLLFRAKEIVAAHPEPRTVRFISAVDKRVVSTFERLRHSISRSTARRSYSSFTPPRRRFILRSQSAGQ